MAWGHRSYRGRRTGRTHKRVPQEPGISARLHRAVGWGVPNRKLPGLRSGVQDREERSTGRSEWYCPGESQEPGRKDEQGSERLHSTAEAGEPISDGTRSREGGRRVTEPLEGNMPEASNSDNLYTRQQRIAELARLNPQMGFTSLNQHIDLPWLHKAYQRTRKDGAVGVDGQTAADYAVCLRDSLLALLARAKSGTYRAPPVRRV